MVSKQWLLDINYATIRKTNKKTDKVITDSRMNKILWDEKEKRFVTYHESKENRHYPYGYIITDPEIRKAFHFDDFNDNDKKMHEVLKGVEYTSRYHPIFRKKISFKKYKFADPLSVSHYIADKYGGYENHIRYSVRWAIDTDKRFGMPYGQVGDKLIPYPQSQEIKREMEMIEDKFFRTPFTRKIDPFIIKNLLPVLFEEAPHIPTVAFDIECLTRGTVRPQPELALEPITSISLAFSETQPSLDNKTGVVLVLDEDVRGLKRIDKHREHVSYFIKNKDRVKLEWFHSEKKLLKRFFEILDNSISGLIITYNGDLFDMPYLKNRCKILDLMEFYYRIRKKQHGEYTYEPQSNYQLDIHKYKIHIDMCKFFTLPYIKAYAFSNRYKDQKLDTVSKALLGIGKVEHEVLINEMPLFELAHYNMEDSYRTLELLMFNDWIPLSLMIMMMRLGYETLIESPRRGITDKIGNLFLWYINNKNWIQFNKTDLPDVDAVLKSTKGDKKFKGSIVIEPKPGIYFDAECQDFAGLYSNTLSKRNISTETVNCGHPECKENIVPEVGHHICTKDMGVASMIVGFITTVRGEYFKKLGKTIPAMKIVEQTLKVFVNASWGFMGDEDSAWFYVYSAESITAFARYSEEELIAEAKRLGMDIVYGDTDSVFLINHTPETIKQLQQFAKEKLNLTLEYEKGGIMFISDRKKNYIIIHREDKEVEVKGMKGKKSDTSLIIRNLSTEIFGILKNVERQEDLPDIISEVKSAIRKVVKKIKMKAGNIEEYTFYKTIQKPLASYSGESKSKDGSIRKKSIPQHVNAAQLEANYLLTKISEEVRANISLEELIPVGKIQGFIKTIPAYNDHKSNVLPIPLASVKDIDSKKYLEELDSAISQITDCLNVDIQEIIVGKSQKSLLEMI